MKHRQRTYIMGAVALLSLAVTLVDALIKPDYWAKVCVKMVCFLAIPLLYFVCSGEYGALCRLFRPRKAAMLRALTLGAAIYGVILGGYFAVRGVVDFSNVTTTLYENHGITGSNFLYVALYVALLNSFLEEFFFRGFGFLALQSHVGRKAAYLFSPIFFAVYHAGMLAGMFDWWVLLILFAGLFAGGCIFNYLNEAGGNLYPSWISHMCANFAINTVGFLLLGAL